MSAGHTPGPWNYGVIRDVLEFQPEWEDVSSDRLDADAVLITAAPDLLAALQDMVDLFRTMHPDLVGNPFFIHARAAIAKAEAVA